MALVTVTRASVLPVTLAEAKRQCRVVDSDTTHDSRLTGYLWDAIGSIERLTGARLASQVVRLELDGFPTGDIDLGVYPVRSIVSFQYDDENDSTQSYNAGSPIDYWANLGGMYPYARAVDGWAATRLNKPASVRITMNVGFTSGNSPDTHPLPADIRHAILMRVSEYFNNSAESVVGPEVFPTVSAVNDLVNMHRRISV